MELEICALELSEQLKQQNDVTLFSVGACIIISSMAVSLHLHVFAFSTLHVRSLSGSIAIAAFIKAFQLCVRVGPSWCSFI